MFKKWTSQLHFPDIMLPSLLSSHNDSSYPTPDMVIRTTLVASLRDTQQLQSSRDGGPGRLTDNTCLITRQTVRKSVHLSPKLFSHIPLVFSPIFRLLYPNNVVRLTCRVRGYHHVGARKKTRDKNK